MSSTRTLDTLARTARTSVGAVMAVVYAPTDDDRLEIVTVAGPAELTRSEVEPATTYAGMVLASQQPMAMQVGEDDRLAAAERMLLGHSPTAICCVPCVGATDVRGVLTLVDKAGGGAFDFDDVEIATMLAEVAGAALDERTTPLYVPSPEQLAGILRDLHQGDLDRYARVASLIEIVLATG